MVSFTESRICPTLFNDDWKFMDYLLQNLLLFQGLTFNVKELDSSSHFVHARLLNWNYSFSPIALYSQNLLLLSICVIFKLRFELYSCLNDLKFAMSVAHWMTERSFLAQFLCSSFKLYFIPLIWQLNYYIFVRKIQTWKCMY